MTSILQRVASGVRSVFSTTKALDPFVLVSNHTLASGDAEVTSPYSQSAWVFAGVRARSRYTASVPMVVVSGRKSEQTGEPVRSDDPWQKLLDRPSKGVSSYKFLESVASYLAIHGEAFIVAYGEAGTPHVRGQIPRELLVVDPRSFEPQVDKDGLLLGWKSTSVKVALTVDQVGLIASFNPDSNSRGLSPLQCVLVDLGFDVKAKAYNSALLSNGADPGGVLYSDSNLSDVAVARLRAQWEDRHRGSIKAARLAILSGGLKYERSAITPKDMSFGDLLDRNKKQILAAIGVNQFDIGDSQDFNRASALAARTQTWESTIVPECRMLEDALWAWLFEPYSANQSADVWVKFDLSKIEALQPNMTEKIQQATGLSMLGYGPDQINERLGLGMPDAPVEEVAPPPEETPPPPAKSIACKAYPRRIPRQVLAVRRRVSQFEQNKAVEVAQRLAQIPRFGLKAVGDLAPLTQEEMAFVLGTPAKWSKDAKAYLSGVLDPVATYALNTARSQFGGFEVVDVADPKWLGKAAQQTASLVQVQTERREAFRKILVKAFNEEGAGNIVEISRRLDQAFADEIPSSADTVARTESAMLVQDVKESAAHEEGFTHKTWSTSGDLAVRPSHAAIDGETVEIRGKFSNGLSFPSQMGGPAEEVINCRCDVVYRVMD